MEGIIAELATYGKPIVIPEGCFATVSVGGPSDAIARTIALLRRLSPAEEGWRPIVREWQDARKAVAQYDGVKDVRVDGDFGPVLNRLANAESALA